MRASRSAPSRACVTRGWMALVAGKNENNSALYTCLHTCLYTCLRTCLYTCLGTCLYTCLRTCLYTCLRTCLYTCLHTCTFTCLYTRLNIELDVQVYGAELWWAVRGSVVHGRLVGSDGLGVRSTGTPMTFRVWIGSVTCEGSLHLHAFKGVEG